MEEMSAVSTSMQINFAVMGKSKDIVETQYEGVKNMISSIPAPPQRGYGDILDVMA
jgi:hypothetical protein